MVNGLFPVNRIRASMGRCHGAQSMRDKDKSRPQNRAWAEKKGPAANQTAIFGIHAVEAALVNPLRTIAKLYLTDNAERRLSEALAGRQLAHERVLPRDLD